jgi:signal recognition particle receptor subunit alpha
VLWSKAFSHTAAPFDALLKDKFLDPSESQGEEYEAAGCTVQWLLDNGHGLIFAVAYPRILTLTYVPALLQTLKTLFISLFGDVIECLVKVLSGQLSADDCTPAMRKRLFNPAGWAWPGWEATFLSVCKEMEVSRSASTLSSKKQLQASQPQAAKVSGKPTEEQADADIIARNLSAFKTRQKSKTHRRPMRESLGSASEGLGGSDTDSTAGTPKAKKEQRKWDHSAMSKDEMAALDFSPASTPSKQLGGALLQASLVDDRSLGQRDSKGTYTVADFTRPSDSDSDDDDDAASPVAAPSSGLFGRLSSALGYSTKSLTDADLAPVIAGIREQLLTKNVASEVAEAICKSVHDSLLGSRQATGFRSAALKKSVKKAMNDALTRILTPKTSSDLLTDIQRKLASTASKNAKEPYTVTFVGVNGVGKSTNLSKIAFWLLQNKLRVLIAACDTFRSGAVEQLKVHVNNLSMLSTDVQVELYQKGYGKDSAGIARDAIAYAKEKDFDVVLIDTAGRMQDNEPLMRALAKVRRWLVSVV